MRFYCSKKGKQDILDAQANKCVYCDREFDVENLPHFDHFLPYIFVRKTKKDNIFAACKRCNLKKSAKIFLSLEEARAHLSGRKIAPLAPDPEIEIVHEKNDIRDWVPKVSLPLNTVVGRPRKYPKVRWQPPDSWGFNIKPTPSASVEPLKTYVKPQPIFQTEEEELEGLEGLSLKIAQVRIKKRKQREMMKQLKGAKIPQLRDRDNSFKEILGHPESNNFTQNTENACS